MNINELIAIVKNKLEKNLLIEQIKIDDKSFIHKNHPNNQSDKFHLKLTIKSDYLKKMNKIESSKKIYKILDSEIKKFIHSLQILIS
jgi:BolA protein